MTHPILRGAGVVVVAREESCPFEIDQFTDRLIGIGQRTRFVELRHGTFFDGGGVVDRDPRKALTDRPQGRALFAGDDHSTLGGAETVPDGAAETPAELDDVAVGCLVAKGHPELVV